MIRVLIIDDLNVASIIDEIGREIGEETGVDPVPINPLEFSGKSNPEEGLQELLAQVRTQADLFWDAIIIDLYLGEFGLSNDRDHQLPLLIGEAVRERNHSANVMLYSGTLADYIKSAFNRGDSDTMLRRIFRSEISNFMPRNRIPREVVSAANNPSCLLRVDRLLTKHSTLVVAPEEAEFKGRTFADLARAVRRQDRDGQRIAELVAEYGVGCFADLNS